MPARAYATFLLCCSPIPKKQQMQWSEAGAHHLLQVRTKVLNDELRATFARWYPGMRTDQETNLAKEAA